MLPLDSSVIHCILREHIRFHSSTEKDSSLSVVTNVDLNLLMRIAFITDPKVEPLHMPSCICIRPQEQIVLIRCHLKNQVQIATLKIGLELQFLL